LIWRLASSLLISSCNFVTEARLEILMKNESIYLNEISQSLTSFKYYMKNNSIQLKFSEGLFLFFSEVIRLCETIAKGLNYLILLIWYISRTIVFTKIVSLISCSWNKKVF
jgi:hypothetical protein